MNNSGTLYVVSTPIGNDDDISLRALKVLKTCDIVVCEEGKVGAKLLRQHKISQPIEELNEHNEDTTATVLLEQLRVGKNLALISDAGTPLLADPGLALVKLAIKHDVPINVVPGASSVLTGLVRSGLPSNQFLFAGFVSRKPDERIAELKELARERRTVILLETPYRLLPLLDAATQVMPKRTAYLGCNLTLPFETHHYGTFTELFAKFTEEKFKGEFVLCFAGNPNAIEEVTAPVETLAKEFFEGDERPKGFQPPSDSDRKPRFDRTKKDFQKPRPAGGYECRDDNGGERPARKFDDDRRGSGEGGDRRPPFKKFDDDRRGSGGSDRRPPFKKFDDDRRGSGEGGDRRPPFKKFDDDRREGGEGSDRRPPFKKFDDDRRRSGEGGDRRPPFKKFDDDRRGGGSARPPFKKFDDRKSSGGGARPPFRKFDDDKRGGGSARPPFKKFDDRNSGGEDRREGGEFRSEGFSGGGGFKGKKPFKKFGGSGKFGAGRGGARSKSRR
ncbi:MAG: 16S rRNA (cytidine(1402)-2'-O)-methyltransferase [Bacteroidetes bacterium]|nr:16S rRNA (cytidine(1402)-2'-O)-methyltransferase [Bacteroidota bacterium]